MLISTGAMAAFLQRPFSSTSVNASSQHTTLLPTNLCPCLVALRHASIRVNLADAPQRVKHHRYQDVVAELTSIKERYEKQPDMFGPSEIRRGSNNNLQPCANPQCSPSNPLFPVCCQTNYTPPPPTPPPPSSSACVWNASTSLGLPNSTEDRDFFTATVKTKEECCWLCRNHSVSAAAAGASAAAYAAASVGFDGKAPGPSCASAHFDGRSTCHLWTGCVIIFSFKSLVPSI